MPPRQPKTWNRVPRDVTDAQIDRNVFEIKFAVEAVRTLRASIMQVIFRISEENDLHGYVVFVDSTLSVERFHNEWERLETAILPAVLDRLTICLVKDGVFTGIPADPTLEMQQTIAGVIENERGKADIPQTDYSFIVPKVLICQWLLRETPIKMEELARVAGCTYLTAVKALRPLGSIVRQTSARRVTLRWFPEDEWTRLVAVSDRARDTVRFAAPPGEARSVTMHVRRLEKLAPPDVAIGGVLGAGHYFPRLDLAGAPRLDLSLHCPGRRMNLDFVRQLDPGLERVDDPLQPAALAVHAVRHADPLFQPRVGGLFWADPVECALDLATAKLAVQAMQFLAHLETPQRES